MRIVIIGGGISGLATAHRLLELSRDLQRPLEITLLEASARLGGTLQTETRDGFVLERGPDSFISEKPQALDLARRLKIDSHLIETNPMRRRSFIVRNGKLRPVPQGFQLLAPSSFFPFLTTSIFSVPGKVRMAADLVLPRKKVNGDADETLAHFVRRRLGDEALARMAQPMVGGIYTADPEKLSLRATFPRFLDMEAQHRSIILALLKAKKNASRAEHSGTSGARYSLFLSFNRGMQLLADALATRISDKDFSSKSACEARLNSPVEALRKTGSEWTIRTVDGLTLTADAVCLAVPAHVAAKLIDEFAPSVAEELAAIPYASTATVNLAYKREDIPHPLDGFGFVVPYVERRSLLACTFSSVKFAGRAPEGCALLRAFVGGALQPDMFALDNDEMIARVTADLRELLGIQKSPLFAEVSKWSRSMPQYELGHLDRVKRIEAELKKLPGLRIVGNAFTGAGIPDCIRVSETAATEILSV